MEEFTEQELDQIIQNLEQLNDSLDNIISLSEEVGDLSVNLNKITDNDVEIETRSEL